MFRKAERKKAKLRLGISGPSGGGKTWSALEIAFGMTTGDKIFVIDTEAGRGELYQGARSKHDPDIIFDYNYYRLEAPYSPDRYVEAIKSAEKEGCEVLIIDSMSHAWNGDGGLLQIVDKAGGQFQNGWKVGTPKQNALIDTIIASKMHVICNFRSKTEYLIEKNEQGKNTIRKVGLAPIQRDQIEYEFTVFMNMGHDNIAHVTKDNSNLFNQEFVQPNPKMGAALVEWLNSGIDQRDKFLSNIMPDLIDHIQNIATLGDLRRYYEQIAKEYAETFPQEFEQIRNEANKRRDELKEELTQLNDIDEMVLKSHESKIIQRGAPL